MELLIIRGSDAGIAAALRARELSDEISISLVFADEYPNVSICGLPFYVSGETPNWRDLAHRTGFPRIEVFTNQTATAISTTEKIVHISIPRDAEAAAGTGRLLGARIVGHWQSEVAKRIDVFASALHHGMTVEALNDLDVSYTPPLGSLGTRCRWPPRNGSARRKALQVFEKEDK